MARALDNTDDQVAEELPPMEDSPDNMQDDGSDDRTNFAIVGSGLDDLESHPPSHLELSAMGEESNIKPYVQSLTNLDLESCLQLEAACLPESQRATREALEYRFLTCGELSVGAFTSADTTDTSKEAEDDAPHASTAQTASTANPVYSGTPARKSVLLAHIIATKSESNRITAADRMLPDTASATGHKESGRTICIHSFAVLPQFQNHGLGTMLLRSYIQRIEGSGLADRIAIVCQSSRAEYMKWFGFESLGKSEAGFVGGDEEWLDLVLEVSKDESE